MSDLNPAAPDTVREPIFIAASSRELDFVERLLVTEGVEFTIRPDAFLPEVDTSAVCFQGLLIEVDTDRAAACR
ncbi:MAG: hypothetical protein ABI837_15680, partial [Acidobacteriota bacterium]